LSGIVQGLAEFADRCPQAVIEINERAALRPQSAPKLLARHHLARAFEQKGQNLKRLVLNLDSELVLSKFPGPEVGFKSAKSNDSMLCGGMNLSALPDLAPKCNAGFEAGQELPYWNDTAGWRLNYFLCFQ
jgi:hypothetical protein